MNATQDRRVMVRRLLGLMAGLIGIGVIPVAQGQEASDKPIRPVVPFTPGGSTDISGRVIAGKLSASLGWSSGRNEDVGQGGASWQR